MNSVELILTIVSAAGGSAIIVAGLAAWLGKVLSDRLAQQQKLSIDIDIDLRKRRIDIYQELWSATSLLPKWPKATGVTYEQLLAFSQILRKWYFEKGGMYFSRSTHDKAYSPFKIFLQMYSSQMLLEQYWTNIMKWLEMLAVIFEVRLPKTSNHVGRGRHDTYRADVHKEKNHFFPTGYNSCVLPLINTKMK